MFIFKSIGSKDVLLPVINRRVHESGAERVRGLLTLHTNLHRHTDLHTYTDEHAHQC